MVAAAREVEAGAVMARAVVARVTALMIEASPGLAALSSLQIPLPRRGLALCSSGSKVGKEMPASRPWLSTASAGSEAACSTRGERGERQRDMIHPSIRQHWARPVGGHFQRCGGCSLKEWQLCRSLVGCQHGAASERPVARRMGAQAKKKGPVKGGIGIVKRYLKAHG